MQIKLKSQLNVQVVGDLKAELESALNTADIAVLDASEVAHVDTAALQLLVSFIQHANLKKTKLEWLNVSEAFSDTARLMGLAKELHLSNDLH